MVKLKRSECSILSLVLKGKWYDMIASGEKREEYRDDKPYWTKRIKNWIDAQGYWVVCFSRGYHKPSMWFLVYATCHPNCSWRAEFHPKWGEPETPHWVIILGERVELEQEAPNGRA